MGGAANTATAGMIDLTTVTPADQLCGETPSATEELKTMLNDARAFLQSFDWCCQIKQSFFGFGIPGVAAVFLFEIRPVKEEIDNWLWVIVGDVPSAYLVTDEARNPAQALQVYISEMRLWVTAVKEDRSTSDLIPVNAPPTIEYAEMLHSRLAFLETGVLPFFKE
jgi:hypothetical protein